MHAAARFQLVDQIWIMIYLASGELTLLSSLPPTDQTVSSHRQNGMAHSQFRNPHVSAKPGIKSNRHLILVTRQKQVNRLTSTQD